MKRRKSFEIERIDIVFLSLLILGTGLLVYLIIYIGFGFWTCLIVSLIIYIECSLWERLS